MIVPSGNGSFPSLEAFRYVVAQNGAQIIEVAFFVGRGDQPPAAVSGGFWLRRSGRPLRRAVQMGASRRPRRPALQRQPGRTSGTTCRPPRPISHRRHLGHRTIEPEAHQVVRIPVEAADIADLLAAFDHKRNASHLACRPHRGDGRSSVSSALQSFRSRRPRQLPRCL
jgi:hypothetical protein